MRESSLLDRRVTIWCLTAVGVAVGWAVVDRSGMTSLSVGIAVVGIVLGIPHGAVDHLVPGLVSARWLSRARRAVVVGVYVAVAAVAALALRWAPDASFVVFLLVSALHFGWAETTYAAERSGHPVPRIRDRWWEVVAHGSVVVAIPMWSSDGRAAMQPLLPHLVGWLDAVPQGWIVGAVVAMCGLTVVRLVADHRALAAIELVAVATLFLVVPVFAAFGVYFGLWHAVRHTSRLMDALAAGHPIHVQVKAFALAAALPTAAAMMVLALLYASRSHPGVVMTGVSVLLALTFPHVVVVGVLDHYRRVDHRP